MKRKQKILIFLIDLFYWPLRFFYTSCRLDRAWMIGTFTNSKCAPVYCDTPRDLIYGMILKYRLHAYNLQLSTFDGVRILEPEFGAGQMLDILKEEFPHSKIVGFEINPVRFYQVLNRLRYVQRPGPNHAILTTSVFTLMNIDFLNYKGEMKFFDAIFMVPPFPGRQFIDHVRHAADFLKDNGILVALIPESVFIGQNLASIAFRQWLQKFSYSYEVLGPVVCNYPVSVVMLTIVNDFPCRVEMFQEPMVFGSIV